MSSVGEMSVQKYQKAHCPLKRWFTSIDHYALDRLDIYTNMFFWDGTYRDREISGSTYRELSGSTYREISGSIYQEFHPIGFHRSGVRKYLG